MAEIGLVASIFGVASFGTKVATSLYEAADIMYHAHQQIASMAKHVTQFTAILRHLGRVLEAEKGSYSNDLLHEIRKIKRSCKKTFKEINATIVSKRYRTLVPVRWLFKKSRAKELEARLGSEQSMLQVMIHTVTVSKLGDMHSKSKEDSKQISGLVEEINVLKTLIIENYNNVSELQRAEQKSEAEARRHPSRHISISPAAEHPDTHRESSAGARIEIHSDETHLESPVSSHSESDHDHSEPNTMPGNAWRVSSQAQGGRQKSDLEKDDGKAADKDSRSAVQPLSAYRGTAGPDAQPVSSLLLQMIPYKPRAPKTNRRRSDLLILGADGATRPDTGPPMMEEVTKSVRLLLDKWTTSGSAPVSDILIDTAAKNLSNRDVSTRNGKSVPGSLGPQPPPPESPWTSDWAGYMTDQYYPHFDDTYRHRRDEGITRRTHERLRRRSCPTNEIWKFSNGNGEAPAVYSGHEILNALRDMNGGILYMKTSKFQHSHFVDNVEFYRHYLVPSYLITPEDETNLSTEIGKGWVRQEALDLLGYTYSETSAGNFSLPGDLNFEEIEELVRLSYRALDRNLEQRSREIIKEQGWRELVASQQRIRDFTSRRRPQLPRSRTRERYSHARYSSISPSSSVDSFDKRFGDLGHSAGLQPHHGPLVLDAHNDIVESRPDKPREEQKKAAAEGEVRFTLPRMANAQSTPAPPRKQKADLETGDKAVREAEEKLEILIKRRDQAIKAKDHSIKSDLELYAIPEMKARIEKLKGAQRKYERTASNDKQSQAPHVAVETDSEYSGESEA